jgi:hypothetical protein
MILRNIDSNSSFKHFKIKISESIFQDYYKLCGENINKNNIILAEGIFDILSEKIFDSTNLRKESCMYIAALSTGYQDILKSIAFYEKIFKMNVYILSDQGIKLKFYEYLKKSNNHIIDKLTVYYNKGGKDFNTFPLTPEKFII